MYSINVFGAKLETCSNSPLTGFFRDGCCHSDATDVGLHTVCCLMTDEFLAFSLKMGNDLISPKPEYEFPGLKDGDQWCLCATRWEEARQAGYAPKVVMASTNIKTLEVIDLKYLKQFQLDDNALL